APTARTASCSTNSSCRSARRTSCARSCGPSPSPATCRSSTCSNASARATERRCRSRCRAGRSPSTSRSRTGWTGGAPSWTSGCWAWVAGSIWPRTPACRRRRSPRCIRGSSSGARSATPWTRTACSCPTRPAGSACKTHHSNGRTTVIDAVGNPQSLLLLGGTSDIALAIAEQYASRRPLRIVLAARPTDRRTAAAKRLSEAGNDVVELDFDANDTDSHPDVIARAFADGDIDVTVVAFGLLGDAEKAWQDHATAVQLAHVNYTA